MFSEDNPKICALCEYAAVIAGDDMHVLCSKKGIMEKERGCRKFLYDPLKRIPHRVTLNTDFSAADFSIE
jgi:hypothetical protein